MKTTEENNRMIAEFMSGQKVTTHHNQYHVSWNELMPVVEKIESLNDEEGEWDCNFEILNGICNVILWHGELAIQVLNPSKIQATYQAVVQFIEWYNEQK